MLVLLPSLPSPGKTACSAARSHKINTGKGVGGVGWRGELKLWAPPVEGVPQELLQGQKFTVVSISPFSSQSGNRDWTLTLRLQMNINSLATRIVCIPFLVRRSFLLLSGEWGLGKVAAEEAAKNILSSRWQFYWRPCILNRYLSGEKWSSHFPWNSPVVSNKPIINVGIETKSELRQVTDRFISMRLQF